MNAANLISILESSAYNMGISLEEMEVRIELKDGWQFTLDYCRRDGEGTVYLITKE